MDRAELLRNINRWIFASVTEHFNNNILDLHVYVEGFERTTRNVTDFVEIRMNGPDVREVSRNYFCMYVEFNALIQSTVVDSDKHRVHTDVGKVTEAFYKAIPVYKYGDGPDDDDSFLGCLILLQEGNDVLTIAHHGRIAIDSPLMQATVEGHYEMYLDL